MDFNTDTQQGLIQAYMLDIVFGCLIWAVTVIKSNKHGNWNVLNKKLCYCRQTAQQAALVKIWLTAEQL